jgi:hypothetical protein
MQRYDYEVQNLDTIEPLCEDDVRSATEEYFAVVVTTRCETVFEVFDRKRGRNAILATCSDRADAELVVRALTALETLAQPSNHNIVEAQTDKVEIAA